MIFSPLTSWAAQWSYDSIREDHETAIPNDRTLWGHVMIQSINAVASIGPVASLTSMANPHRMSYLYKGLDASQFGIRAAEASRASFQLASSKAYRIGERLLPFTKLGGKIGARAIPGLGYAMLAYDAWDLVSNRRLFGVQL